MPYTIPSSVISPGSVYQPRQIPAVISQNARALYYTRGGSTSGSLLLDQSPLNSGTRRTGEQGQCWHYDGSDDFSTAGDLSASIKTIAFRIKPIDGISSGTAYIIDLNGTDYIKISAQGLTGLVQTSGFAAASVTIYVDGVVSATVSDDKFYSVVVVSDTGFSASDFEIGRLSGTGNSEFEIFDVRLSEESITADQVTHYHTFGESGDAVTWLEWWKADEQSGITGYSSSGSGNTITHTNITAATFHSTQDIWSFQNQVGYNTSGAVYIPRDESDPTNDVLGNPLTNTGRRPNDSALHSSNCLTADGTLYIAAAHLAGTETVVSSGGTSTPSISAGRIDFTAGTCWNLTLSDGTHYKLAEGYGTAILDASGNGNHGVLTSAVLANAWGATQNVYHSNLIDGSGKRMWFDGASNYVDLANLYLLLNPSSFSMTIKEFYLASASITIRSIIFSTRLSASGLNIAVSNAYNFQIFEGGLPLGAFTSYTVPQKQKIKLQVSINGTIAKLFIDNVFIEEITLSSGCTISLKSEIGAFSASSIYYFNGALSGISFFSDDAFSNSIAVYDGYGNTDSDWIDITGNGNDGTVVGSPEAFYIPAAPDGLDVFGNELTEKPSDIVRNRAETLIDLDPDSTPEMGATQLGITVPASHAFGDAFAASDQIFSRQRTLTEDRFVVMPEAQTGSALATIQRYTQP